MPAVSPESNEINPCEFCQKGGHTTCGGIKRGQSNKSNYGKKLPLTGHRRKFCFNFMPFLQAFNLFSVIECKFLNFSVPH